MILVSIGGLIVNLIGLVFFHENEEQNENIYGLFLHVLADTLGSVGVLVSCYLVTNYNISVADPVCAMVVSIMIFVSVLPLIKMSCEGLLLQTPDNIYQNYGDIRQKIL
jgi:solute carrier family 30 (zinc transporter), member 5/7